MKRALRSRRLLAWTLLALSATSAFAADEPHVVVIDVRRGISLLSDGEPVSGASVAAVRPGDGPEQVVAEAVRTDGEGRAALSGVRGGCTVLVFGPDVPPIVQYVRAPVDGGVVNATVAVEASASAELRVTDPSGDAITDAVASLVFVVDVLGRPPAGKSRHGFTLTTVSDEKGRVLFDHIPGGVVAEASARADGWVGSERLPLRIGDGVVPELVLRRGGALSGLARAVPGGTPAVGVTLTLGPSVTKTDDDGRFTFRGVDEGAHVLSVAGSEFVLREAPKFVLSEGETRSDVVVTLVRAARLTGVVSGIGGESLGGAEILIEWPPRADGRPESVVVTADGEGGFRIAGLQPADGVRVEARFPGFAPLVRTGISLAPGADGGPLSFELDEGGRLAGRIVTGGALGVGDVEIAVRREGEGAGRPPLATAVTDENGEFRLDGVPSEPVMLVATPPMATNLREGRFGPFIATADDPAPTGDLSLRLGYELTVVVPDAPLGTMVSVTDADGASRMDEVGADDTTVFAGLAPGTATVSAHAPGSDSVVTADTVLPSGWPLELKLAVETSVNMRVVSPEGTAVTRLDLTALAVPEIDLREGGTESPAHIVSKSLSDPAGQFSVRLPPGRSRLELRSDALHGAVEAVVVATDDGAVQDIGTVRLSRGEIVRGEVVGADGGAVEGARISVEPAGDAAWLARTSEADARGRFAVLGVPPGVARIVVEADGYAPHVSTPFSVHVGALVDLGVVTLSPGVLVRGNVTSAHGVAATAVEVVLDHDNGFTFAAQTDSFGRFEMPGVPPGAVVVTVGDRRVRLEVPRWGREREVNIDLDAGTRFIGRLLRDGRPEAFAHMRARGGVPERVEVTTRTDASGGFALPPLPPGPMELEVAPLAGITHLIKLDLPDAPEYLREIELPTASLSGVVRDTEDGRAVPGASVYVWETDEDGLRVHTVASVVSGSSGEFTARGLAPGDYSLEARAPGRSEGLAGPVRVGGDGPDPTVEIALPREAALVARLVDHRGRPVPHGWISAVPTDVNGVRVRLRARAGVDGRVRLGGLGRGDLQVEAGAWGRGRALVGGFILGAGEVYDVGDISLELAGALRVLVLYNGFFPAEGHDVSVEDLGGRDPRGDPSSTAGLEPNDSTRRTGVDGVVQVPDLSPGTYRVRVAGTDFTVRVLVTPGEVAKIVLWAPPADSPR